MRKTCQLAKSWVVISLLSLYLLGSFNMESFHTLIHDHEETVLHTEENEANPCHIALYHQEREGRCHHDAHLVEEDKCSFCQIQFQKVHVPEVCAIVLPITYGVNSSSISYKLYVERINAQSTGRAPPVS